MKNVENVLKTELARSPGHALTVLNRSSSDETTVIPKTCTVSAHNLTGWTVQLVRFLEHFEYTYRIRQLQQMHPQHQLYQ